MKSFLVIKNSHGFQITAFQGTDGHSEMLASSINFKSPELVLRTSLPLARVACEKCTPGLFSCFIWLVFQIIGIYEVTEAPQTTALMREFATHVSAGRATALPSLQVGDSREHHVAGGWIHIAQLAGLTHRGIKQFIGFGIHPVRSPQALLTEPCRLCMKQHDTASRQFWWPLL